MKKMTLLYTATTLVILGIFFTSFVDIPSIFRYFISILGTCIIIFIASLIGFEGVKFFSFKSTLGKALFFITSGLISFGAGNLLWLYYNVFASIEVPYPSLADIGFLGIIPLAGYGLFLIVKSIKIKFDFATYMKMFIPALFVTIACYFLFVSSKIAENVDPLTKFLNVAYPVGDIIFLSFAVIILSLSIGGLLFKPLGIISLGFIFEATADFLFSYTTTIGIYFTGYWIDVFWVLAFFCIAIGMHEIVKSHERFVKSKS